MMFLYVALGGAIGASFRHFVSMRMLSFYGSAFPYGTLTVNILGSFLMGVIITYLVKTLPHSNELRMFLVVGVLGGFTTFSAFALDFISLMEDRGLALAAFYIVLSVIGSILAILFGVFLTRAFL